MIDARELSKGQPGGFRSYLGGLLGGLAEVDGRNEYVLLAERRIPDGVRLPAKTEVRTVSRNRLIADRFSVRDAALRARPDVAHFPCNYGCFVPGVPTVITLHDCICLDWPASRGSLKHRLLSAYNERMTRQTVPNADRVITISEYSRAKIREHFDLDDRVRVVYQGVSAGAECRNGSGTVPSGRYVLVLAAPDPRKNVAKVVDAFAKTRARRYGLRLAVVANHPSGIETCAGRAEALGLGESVDVLSGVGDSELRRLYRGASAFIFASLEEGFGLPPLEAMSEGCPVLSSDASVMPEVLGDSALYFDPLDARGLAEKIDSVVGDEGLRESLRAKGLERASIYSWKKTAAATLEVYAELADHRPVRNSPCGR